MLTMANTDMSPETELDAILGQLCALETQIDRELSGRQQQTKSVVSTDTTSTNGSRTDSPDNDSAYSDSLSMQSSSGSGAPDRTVTSNVDSSQAPQPTNGTEPSGQPTNGQSSKDVQLFVKVFTADNSAKSLLADEHMNVSVICRQLAEKNQIVMEPKCSIVEHLPELYLERFYEDNESLVENVLLWTKESTNRLYFMEKEEKYDLFVNPERYLLEADSSERGTQLDDEARASLIEEFFTGGVPVPEVEGPLYLRSDGKKAWKKHFFVLRASGLYYSPKGKSKSSKDLVCLTTFEMNNVYYGVGWRKKYKAPNDYGFAIKHPQIQAKNSKYIKYLCADSERELRLWTTGIRIAKYGRQLKDNYDNIMRDIVEADLDSLANRRSFSVCSMARSIQLSPLSPVNTSAPIGNGCAVRDVMDRPVRPTSITITTNNGNNWPHRMSRHDSLRSSSTSSSSGCLSERGSNVSTPTMEQFAFEADFPIGTIKRKPSALQPKIPLTSTTRTLALLSDDALVQVDSSDEDDEDNGQRQCGTLRRGTMRRSATDERLKNRIYEPLREQRYHNQQNTNSHLNHIVNDKPIVQCTNENIEEELPLPPPPQVLQPSLSTLSLNSLPPPPSELMDSTVELDSNSTTPTPMSPVVTPKHSPQSPQVPPKPKLFRRLSESANDRNNFVNELKNRANTLQRGLNARPKIDMSNAYATSPRMKNGPYVQAMNGGSSSPMTSTFSLNSSRSGGSSPSTPVTDKRMVSPNHSRSPVHYKQYSAMPVSAQVGRQSPLSSPRSPCSSPLPPPPPQHCYQTQAQVSAQAIYQSYEQIGQQTQESRQLYGNNVMSNQNQNNCNINNNRIASNLNQSPIQYQSSSNNNNNYCNNNSVVNKMGHHMQPQPTPQQQHQHQPYYPFPQSYQVYGQLPAVTPGPQQVLPMPPQHFQQQQITQQFFRQQPQQQQHYQQSPQLPVPHPQVYSNQQPIYGQHNHPMVNSQTYTKQKIYSVPPVETSDRSPMKGPLPPPPEEFLREIQRVMEKKWKVAQTLSSDLSATPNQILGFRDPIYLAPNTEPTYGNNMYDVLPTRPGVKSVRISDQVNEIPVSKYNCRRMPPPPPKRSEKTHLSQRSGH